MAQFNEKFHKFFIKKIVMDNFFQGICRTEFHVSQQGSPVVKEQGLLPVGRFA
jgi:hypothetical protein